MNPRQGLASVEIERLEGTRLRASGRLFYRESSRAMRWAIIAGGLLTACSIPQLSPTVTPVPSKTATIAAENWQIQLRVSGGFAGIRRVLDVASTGQLTAVDEKTSRQISAQVPAKELSEINALLKTIQSYQLPSRPPPCPDCFNYALNVRLDGKPISVEFNDQNLSASGWAPLVGLLSDLLQRALDGKLKP